MTLELHVEWEKKLFVSYRSGGNFMKHEAVDPFAGNDWSTLF